MYNINTVYHIVYLYYSIMNTREELLSALG